MFCCVTAEFIYFSVIGFTFSKPFSDPLNLSPIPSKERPSFLLLHLLIYQSRGKRITAIIMCGWNFAIETADATGIKLIVREKILRETKRSIRYKYPICYVFSRLYN